jgi:hypothetical protein
MPALPARFAKLARLLCLLAFAFAALAASFSLKADTPASSPKQRAGGCYCGCTSKSGRLSGCTKMCDLPKYANQWWATTCRKPHIADPIEHRDAGPRFPHPGRAERASR